MRSDKLNERNEKLAFNKGRMSKWENGKEEPRLSSVKSIADFYGINIDSFYLDEETKSSSISTIYNQLEQPRQKKVYNYAEDQLEKQNNNDDLLIAAHINDDLSKDINGLFLM